MPDVTKVVIIGGGPGGYEAALVGAQLGGEVTLVDSDGIGGSAVLTDCVPSKSLIATSNVMSTMEQASGQGLYSPAGDEDLTLTVTTDLAAVNTRVIQLAEAQSGDIAMRLVKEGVRIVRGKARLEGTRAVVATTEFGEERLEADVILVSTGAHPRVLPDAMPDGERILDWTQVYNLTELPEHLIVVGSGVTGAEFANAYDALGVRVTLVSSRDMVLPGEDPDAARVLQDVFERRGITIISRARAVSARREGDGVVVGLEDGREVVGSHVLMAVGSIPNTAGIGLEEAGVELDKRGYVTVDKVSRTSARGVYGAGDCTGVFALASVAAMQGRIAMWHALGDAVPQLRQETIASNIFTAPEIATVGVTQKDIDEGHSTAEVVMMPLASNARAKMQGFTDGFVKLFCLPLTGIIVGGVIVAPTASELIHAVSLAVAQRISVDDFSHAFTVYPSLSGSIAEAARRLHTHGQTATAQLTN
ncbi:NAD(P)H-quinone dehydrogenase [Raineyella fluvialis]|uniref:NAD(P)H dehydrogenase (quinone) n=1 Tax=Raineyella fluvialis TaxID=2662261 RepID=A0A5Q2F7S3_9ACTN|nr:NAD(P)H-quinone dehydrogenase [Raineyella fluvialis]